MTAPPPDVVQRVLAKRPPVLMGRANWTDPEFVCGQVAARTLRPLGMAATEGDNPPLATGRPVRRS
jgi:hypothetical protein